MATANTKSQPRQRVSFVDLDLPVYGIYKGSAWHEIPKGYTPDCNNVSAYDNLERQRVAVRCGSSKYFSGLRFGTGTTRFVQYMGQAEVQVSGTTTNYIIIVCGGITYAQKPSSSVANRIDGGVAAFSVGRRVVSDTLFGVTYFTDGLTNMKYTWSTATWAAWTASAGTFPIGTSKYCRYIKAWRGRMVMAHLEDGNPDIIFFTKQGDPTNFDYGVDPETPVMAVATNTNFRAGQIGQPVTALIPCNNDRLLIGLDHAIYQMLGDPADGGQLSPLSETVGILNDDAWCMATNDDGTAGTIWFVGTGGLYQMDPGGQPRLISNQAFNQNFIDLPQVGYYVECEYDRDRHRVWIFITQVATPYATKHCYYDLRSGGLFPFSFPADTGGDDGSAGTGAPTYGPSKALTFDGYDENGNDRVVLMGCRDGYVRQFSDTTYNDDGAAISSYCWVGPLQPGGAAYEARINGWYPVMAEYASNFNCTWALYGGADPYTTYTSGAAKSGTFTTGGRQSPRAERLAANSFFFKFSNSTASKGWGLERITVRLEPAGPVR